MSDLLDAVRRAGLAAMLATAAMAVTAPDAAASPIEVRDGNGGNVFNGNGVGSQNLTIKVDGANKSVAAGAFALQYRLSPADAWTSFLTYCLEPDETLGISAGTVYQGDLVADIASSSEYAAHAASIARMYSTHFADSLTGTTRSAAFQVALWELAYDGGANLAAGKFQLVGSTAVRDQAALYLNSAGWVPLGDAGVILRVGNQDLVIDLPTPSGGPVPAPVPEPVGLTLFGLGLAALGAAQRRRRAVAAAG